MDLATILKLLVTFVPEAADAYAKIRSTLSETDLAPLDAQLAVADAQVTVDHDALKAAITG